MWMEVWSSHGCAWRLGVAWMCIEAWSSHGCMEAWISNGCAWRLGLVMDVHRDLV